MYEDSYLDTYWEDRYDTGWSDDHPGLDPTWEGHWGDDDADDSDLEW